MINSVRVEMFPHEVVNVPHAILLNSKAQVCNLFNINREIQWEILFYCPSTSLFICLSVS